MATMNKSNLKITLPLPCQEVWDTMTPVSQGRHCAQCSKTVIDFTLMSDGEILDVFRKAKGCAPCGHFLETQLNRELVDMRYKPSLIVTIAKRAAALVLLWQSVAVAALAQTVKKAPVNRIAGKKPMPVKDSRLQICGYVAHYAHGGPIGGVRVTIKGTQIESVSDNSGMFILTLPDIFYMEHLLIEGTIEGKANTVVIEEQTMSFNDVLNNKELKLFAYKVQTLPVHNVAKNNYRPVKLTGIAPMQPVRTDPVETGIWSKIRKPFKRKKHS